MKFPIETFGTDVDARWDSILRFAKCMYGIPCPSQSDECFDLPGLPAMPKSFHKWVAFSRNLSTDVGFHFFDFEPRYDETLEHVTVANFNQFGKWGIRSSEVELDDPPIDAFQFVRSQNKFVPRKMSRVDWLTQWALELLIEHGSIHSIGKTLDSPIKFVKELGKHCPVSERIGNNFLTGGPDWYATVSAGSGPFGSAKCVVLRYKEATDKTTIPQFLVETMGLKSHGFGVG